MKKIILLLVLLLESGVCMAIPKIISSEYCEYKDVTCNFFDYQKWFKKEISYNQAIDDLEMFIYLLKTAYAGYEDATGKGLQIEGILKSFENNFQENDMIKASIFSNFLYEYLKPYVQDCHFTIEGDNFSKSLISYYRILYSNIYLKKLDNKYIVVKSDNSDIKIGDNLECECQNLFLYPSEGDLVYRIGAYACLEKSDTYISVISSGVKKNILCCIDTERLYTEKLELYKEIETQNSVYIFLPTLIDLEKVNPLKVKLDENYKKLGSISERYSDKKYIILDLRANHGGNDYYTFRFLSNLYHAEKKCTSKITELNIERDEKIFISDDNRIDLISPSIIQAELWYRDNCLSNDSNFLTKFNSDKKILKNEHKRIKIKNIKNKKSKVKPAKFKGKLIILTGKNTASSGEDTILYAKKMFLSTDQLILLGENTMGCFAYGNVFCYQLPNSGIALHMGAFSSNLVECVEGVGIMPDFYSTNEDLLKALVKITNEEELIEKLMDINKL